MVSEDIRIKQIVVSGVAFLTGIALSLLLPPLSMEVIAAIIFASSILVFFTKRVDSEIVDLQFDMIEPAVCLYGVPFLYFATEGGAFVPVMLVAGFILGTLDLQVVIFSIVLAVGCVFMQCDIEVTVLFFVSLVLSIIAVMLKESTEWTAERP